MQPWRVYSPGLHSCIVTTNGHTALKHCVALEGLIGARKRKNAVPSFLMNNDREGIESPSPFYLLLTQIEKDVTSKLKRHERFTRPSIMPVFRAKNLFALIKCVSLASSSVLNVKRGLLLS